MSMLLRMQADSMFLARDSTVHGKYPQGFETIFVLPVSWSQAWLCLAPSVCQSNLGIYKSCALLPAASLGWGTRSSQGTWKSSHTPDLTLFGASLGIFTRLYRRHQGGSEAWTLWVWRAAESVKPTNATLDRRGSACCQSESAFSLSGSQHVCPLGSPGSPIRVARENDGHHQSSCWQDKQWQFGSVVIPSMLAKVE